MSYDRNALLELIQSEALQRRRLHAGKRQKGLVLLGLPQHNIASKGC